MSQSIDTGNPSILAEIEDQVGYVTINRPERHNALDTAMWKSIASAVAALESAADVRVIAVRGAGDKAFCAGADIAEFDTTRATTEASRAYDAMCEAAYGALRHTNLPTVALVQGICFGGGLGLAASCDLRIGTASSIYAIPAGRLGLAYPHESLSHLVRSVGSGLAKHLIFTGARIDAAHALRAGLLNEVVEDGFLQAHGTALCQQIAHNAPLTLRAAKYVIDSTARNPASIDMGRVSAFADACYESEDYVEGRRAFAEKRAPQFTGR